MGRKPFTLVELIVVITIIIILVGIALPAYVLVTRKAKVTQTRARIAAIKTALAGYKGQFGYLPYFPSQGESDYQTASESGLIGDLKGGNSRGIKFLTVSDTSLVDSWGAGFEFGFDLGGDQELSPPTIPADAGTITAEIAVWSKGPDGQHDLNSANTVNEDNVVSWE